MIEYKTKQPKIFIDMQPLMAEMIECSKCDSHTYSNKHEYYKLRTLKLLGNAVWQKISSVTSSFVKWKLTWICRSQNHLTMGHFNR